MIKRLKIVLVNFLLFTSLALLAIFFSYGFDYYNLEYRGRIEEKKMSGELAAHLSAETKIDPRYHSSLFIGEVLANQSESAKWGDLYFLTEDGDEFYLTETRYDVSAIADPVASSNQLFYYAWGREEGKEAITLHSRTLASGREGIVAAPGRDYSLRGAWLSPDGKNLTYQRFKPDTGQTSYWNYGIENNMAEEIVAPGEGFYPVPYQAWGVNSERFYFTKNVGHNSHVLYEARGSVVTSAFPAFRWDRVDWSDMWQVKPFAVSPDGMAAVYVDRRLEGNLVVLTDINIIDQSGGITNLATVPGDVYELAWSPDGRQVAFNFAAHDGAGVRDRAELGVMKSNGDDLAKIHATETGAMLHDLHWGHDSENIYFIERLPRSYSLVQTVNVVNKKVNTLERYVPEPGQDSYLRLLQRLDMPKALDWQEK